MINIDDPRGRQMAMIARERGLALTSIGRDPAADLRILGQETLLTSNEVTRFDAILFGSMHLRLARGESICFPQLEWVATPPEIRKLVTTRLKLTGYKYFPSTMSWVLREEKPLVPLQREL